MKESLDAFYEHCDKHGKYRSGYLDKSGYRRVIVNGCIQCWNESRIEAFLEKVGHRYRDCEFDTYRVTVAGQQAALGACKGFVDSRGTNIILSGPAGVGKNHLAAAVGKTLIRQGYCVQFWRMQSILQSYWAMAIEQKEYWLDRFSELDLLILDELDKSSMTTEAAQRSVFDLFDYLWREEIPVMILTGLNEDGLQSYIGEEAFDRLQGVFITMDWGSYRSALIRKRRVEYV